jgi:hypothetical protein
MKLHIAKLSQRRITLPNRYNATLPKPRIYVDIKGEEFDKLHTRIGMEDKTKEEKTETRRMYNAQRKVMREAIAKAFRLMGFQPDEAAQAAKDSKWSWYAGCSMCRCSSGFIFKSDSLTPLLKTHDLWVTAEVVHALGYDETTS